MDIDWKKLAKKVIGASGGFMKGCVGYYLHTGHNYEVRLYTSSSCRVDVLDKTLGGKGVSVFRLDKAHREPHFYNHVNINPKISGLPHDPYPRLPPGGLTTGTYIAKFCKIVNKVALAVALISDAVEIEWSFRTDFTNGTTRNTMESVAGVAGGWGGGYGGAAAGAAIGTAISPEIGTIIGGIVGGLGGGIGGALGVSAAAEAIGDAVDYGVEEMPCMRCGRNFRVRIYRGERNRLCPECPSLRYQ